MAAKSCERLGNEINLWTEKLLFMFAGGFFVVEKFGFR
jgi:hypothetical protein